MSTSELYLFLLVAYMLTGISMMGACSLIERPLHRLPAPLLVAIVLLSAAGAYFAVGGKL